MSGERVLVTGASGVVGRFLTPALLEGGFVVRGQYLRNRGVDSRVEWRQWDFLKQPDACELVENCDAVIHLAAELGDIARMPSVNVNVTRALALAAAKAGVRYFGHASSIVVYGSPKSRNVTEATPRIDPRAPMAQQYQADDVLHEYARTKALAEETIEALNCDLSVDLYRPTIVADNHRLLEFLSWSLPRKIQSINRCTQFIHGRDTAAAVVHLLRRGLNRGRSIEAYNICDETCGSYLDLLKVVQEETGQRIYSPPPFAILAPLEFLREARYSVGLATRHGLTRLRVSAAKLRGAGFQLPLGIPAAVRQAVREGLTAPTGGGSEGADLHGCGHAKREPLRHV